MNNDRENRVLNPSAQETGVFVEPAETDGSSLAHQAYLEALAAASQPLNFEETPRAHEVGQIGTMLTDLAGSESQPNMNDRQMVKTYEHNPTDYHYLRTIGGNVISLREVAKNPEGPSLGERAKNDFGLAA